MMKSSTAASAIIAAFVLQSCGTDPTSSQTAVETLSLTRTNSAMTEIIGNASGTSSHQASNSAADSVDGIGGAWDSNTIGRLLWQADIPTSIRGREIVSAKATFTIRAWGSRAAHGQTFVYEAHRMLREWSETEASGLVSASGSNWHKPLVGLDDVDAASSASGKDSIPDQSTGTFSIDITPAVRKWAAEPDSNFGLVFRSIHEFDGTFLDYPTVYMNDALSPAHQPRLIVTYR